LLEASRKLGLNPSPEGRVPPKAAGGAMANDVARKLRKTMTRQEVKLWVKLRELRTIGHHFRRQSPLARYVVDFECRKSRLVIEVDGNQHRFDENRWRDATRDRALNDLGYRVLRFGNYEVDREFDGVLEAIRVALETQPHPAASRPPSPDGEG
jgi:very-short-patch-repair endonuclease